MATTNIKYATAASLTMSSWSTDLLDTEFAGTNIVDNTGTTELFVDVLVGGSIQVHATTGPAAGKTFNIYVYGQYSDTATDIGGAIGALFGATEDAEQTSGTDIEELNLVLLKVVATEAVNKTYHWGPVSIANAFGGTMPKKWGLIGYNNTGGALGGLATAEYIGVEYETA